MFFDVRARNRIIDQPVDIRRLGHGADASKV